MVFKILLLTVFLTIIKIIALKNYFIFSLYLPVQVLILFIWLWFWIKCSLYHAIFYFGKDENTIINAIPLKQVSDFGAGGTVHFA